MGRSLCVSEEVGGGYIEDKKGRETQRRWDGESRRTGEPGRSREVERKKDRIQRERQTRWGAWPSLATAPGQQDAALSSQGPACPETLQGFIKHRVSPSTDLGAAFHGRVMTGTWRVPASDTTRDKPLRIPFTYPQT